MDKERELAERRRAEVDRLRERNRQQGVGKAQAPLRVQREKVKGCGGCGAAHRDR